jgi:hypothetical protein
LLGWLHYKQNVLKEHFFLRSPHPNFLFFLEGKEMVLLGYRFENVITIGAEFAINANAEAENHGVALGN